MRFSSARVKFIAVLMSILKRQGNSSSNLASFFIVVTNNSPVSFKLKYFQLWTKESHQTPNFETYRCSGENLPNSLCYFPNQKLVFLQILHHSLGSWNITPPYFFRSNITGKTNQSANFWDFWVLGSKSTKFLSFLKQQSFSSNFFINLECHQE